jgi:4-hydroxybenzoate polyprenyltransferase
MPPLPSDQRRHVPSFPSMPAAATPLRVLALCERAADRWYRGLLEALVYSSIWLSAALGSLAVFAVHALHLTPTLEPTLLIFFSSLFIYNLDHVADARVEGIPDDRAKVYFRSAGVGLLIIAAGLATGLMVASAPGPAQLVFALYTTIGLVYGLPILPVPRAGGLRWHRLKDIPGLKAWIVAATVAFATVGLPLAWTGTPLDIDAWSLAVFVFAFAGSGAHMCDIRDIDEDTRAGVATFPVRAGVRRTKEAAILLNLVVILLMVAGWMGGLTGPHPEMIVVCGIMIGFIAAIRVDSSEEAYNVVLDGTYYLPALLGLLHEGLR